MDVAIYFVFFITPLSLSYPLWVLHFLWRRIGSEFMAIQREVLGISKGTFRESKGIPKLFQSDSKGFSMGPRRDVKGICTDLAPLGSADADL